MSLYSEYRNLFPEIITNLENARNSGRLAHAFLIRSDNIKTACDFALVLAQIYACPRHNAGRPDTDCNVCRKLESGTYPEIHTLTPQGKKFQIRVGEIDKPEPNTVRSFLYDLSLTASSLYPIKIGMIINADRMNPQAQNALLKTLEEPAGDTVIILVTTNASSLLPTTRSRCQIIELPGEGSRICFAGAEKLFDILFDLTFSCGGDLADAENLAAALIGLFDDIHRAAEEKSKADFARQFEIAGQIEDPVYLKTLEERRSNAASGNYMQIRQEYLSGIHSFFAQLYMLTSGVAFDDLPDNGIFAGREIPPVSAEKSARLLQEADTLLYTLLFNVNETLALRTFAISVALA